MTHSILRLPAVKTRTGLSRSTIYLRISKNEFPAPISLGGRAVGWVESDIDSWLAEKIEAARQVREITPKSANGFETAVLRHKKQVNPTQSMALPLPNKD